MIDIEQLTLQAANGDEDALVSLLESAGPEVERSLAVDRIWRSSLDTADVMQVTYLEAFLQIRKFDPSRREPFLNWLKKIAENNLRDAVRGLQRHKRPQPNARLAGGDFGQAPSDLLAVLGVASTTPSRYAAREERSDRLNFFLDTLPQDYAAAIRLYDLQGLPIGEVARCMKRSPGAVHMLRARAHDCLRALIGEESNWFSSQS